MPSTLSKSVAGATLVACVGSAHAMSPEAKVVDGILHGILCAQNQSFALSGRFLQLRSDLRAVAYDAESESKPDQTTVREAEQLIHAFPSDLPNPEFSCEDDGAIALEWLPNLHTMVSVSVNGSGRLAYAWVSGSDRGHAVARFDGKTFPPVLYEIIRGVAGHHGPSIGTY